MEDTDAQRLAYRTVGHQPVDLPVRGSAGKVVIHTDDRPGMLNQLTSVLFDEQSNIRSLEARGDDKHGADSAVIEMTVEIRDKKQLERLVSAIRRISGVRDVERTQ